MSIAFSTDQADGAIPNGTRIRKINSEPGDAHLDGSTGVVVGSLGPADGEYGYFVEWADTPDIPVFVRGSRIETVPARILIPARCVQRGDVMDGEVVDAVEPGPGKSVRICRGQHRAFERRVHMDEQVWVDRP